jgi:glycosyltransferase involved in cell wall biosynthesis
LISVIIPCFNRAHLLYETLNSIISQSYNNWECIIIDDGSTDNTFEILSVYAKNDSRIKYFSRPINIMKGATACRNYGFTLSNGDYICWFDSDDIMPVNSLKDRIEVLVNNEYDFVLGRLMNFYEDYRVLFDEKKSSLKPSTTNPAGEYIIGNFWFQTSVPIFKKSFLNKFNRHFDENLTFHDEAEFFVRLLLENPNICFVDSVVTLRRMHNDSLRVGVNTLGNSEKILFDQYGYFKIWKSFKKNKIYYDNNIHLYFKYYFKYWLVKMKFNSFRLSLIYLNGILYKMFDNNYLITKIYIWRLFKRK